MCPIFVGSVHYLVKKCLFPIDAYVVWCQTWSKNLGRYLLQSAKQGAIDIILTQVLRYFMAHVKNWSYKLDIKFYETIYNNAGALCINSAKPGKIWAIHQPSKARAAVRYRETYNRSIYIPYFETGRIARQSRRREKEDWHMVKSWSDPMNIVKSVNLQYITPGCWDDGTNESLTKSLILQVLFSFSYFL